VRKYDVTTKLFTNFVQPGTMGQPWYLTFGYTDPATLAYNPPSAASPSNAPNSGAATTSPVTAAASASSSGANDWLFVEWAEDFLTDAHIV
jgi:hypothetical protein